MGCILIKRSQSNSVHSGMFSYYTANVQTQSKMDSFLNIVYIFLFLQHTSMLRLTPLKKLFSPTFLSNVFLLAYWMCIFLFIISIFLLPSHFLAHYNLVSDPIMTENFLRSPMTFYFTTEMSPFEWFLHLTFPLEISFDWIHLIYICIFSVIT